MSGASEAAQTAAPPRAWLTDAKILDLAPVALSTASNPIDYLLVQDVINRWGIAYDEGRLDIIEELFTDDAAYIVYRGTPEPIIDMQGRTNILESVRTVMQRQNDQRRHAVSNIVLNALSDDRAKAVAYGIVAIPGDEIIIGASVAYSADLRKEDGRWRFSRFAVAMDRYV